jgi:predicted Zn-dependent protease
MDQFPNDPAAQLYAIQANILRHRHETALRFLSELNKSIGGDPYIDAIRADLYFQQGDIQTAKSIAAGAVEMEQGLNLAYWTLVKAAVKERAFAEAVKWLDALCASGVAMEAIHEALNEYSEFLDSAEFWEWKERQSAGE